MNSQTQIDVAKARQISKTTPAANQHVKKNSNRRQSKLTGAEIDNKLTHAKAGKKKVKHVGDYPHDMLAQELDDLEVIENDDESGAGDDSQDDKSIADESDDCSEDARKERAEMQRLYRKPLQFGIEQQAKYKHHKADIKDFVQNTNNNVNVTYSAKEVHFWSNQPGDVGRKIKSFKILTLAKMHTQVTCVCFSKHYRIYIVFTANFKIFVLNELYRVVSEIPNKELEKKKKE